MQKKTITAGLMGMNQDLINPKVNSTQAYEIKNFRINATGHSNGIELTTEKGTKFIRIKDYTGVYIDEFTWQLTSNIIGHCVINEHLVLFIKGTQGTKDRILNLTLGQDNNDEDVFVVNEEGSFCGDLDFDTNNKIEAIPYYESEDIIKVYWIDGKNYPRVINLRHDYGYPTEQDYDPFSFYQVISNGQYNTIDVQKQYIGGMFYAGVVQYSFSFYNKNAQETPVIYTTPLNYVSHSDMGEQPNKQLGCAFKVELKVNETDIQRFEYARVYSIYRSSINGTPVVKVVNDIKCDNFQQDERIQDLYRYTFVDDNQQGYDFDAYRIIIQNEFIRPDAIAQKDNKLFLADFTVDRQQMPWDAFKNLRIDWDVITKQIPIDNNTSNGVYPYKNQMTSNSQSIKTFKQNEWYKLGLQFQDEYGKWSQPYLVQTTQNNGRISINNTTIFAPVPRLWITVGDIKDILDTQLPGNKYVKVRAVASFPSISERSILCQGIENPTVFNFKQRKDSTCRAQASWFFRPTPPPSDEGQYNGFGFAQYKDGEPLHGSDEHNGEVQCMYFDKEHYVIESQIDPIRGEKNYDNITQEDGLKYNHCYYVDRTYMTINSPDLEFDDNIKNVDLSQYDIYNYTGRAYFKNIAGKYTIVATPPLFLNSQKMNGEAVTDDDVFPHMIRSSKIASGAFERTYEYYNDRDQCHGRMLLVRTMWFDDACNLFSITNNNDEKYVIAWNKNQREIPYAVYPWQRQYLNNYNDNKYNRIDTSQDTDEYYITTEPESSKIIRKVLSNTRFCTTSYFQNTQRENGFEQAKLYDSKEAQLIKFDSDIYYGNVDQLVTCTSEYMGWSFNKVNNILLTQWYYNKMEGYPIIADKNRLTHDMPDTPSQYDHNSVLTSDYDMTSGTKMLPLDGIENTNGLSCNAPCGDVPSPNVSSCDPIMIRYKSSPHIVCKFSSGTHDSGQQNNNIQDAYCNIVDLCRDTTDEPYRNDNSKSYNLSRTWVPCSDPVLLASNSSERIKWMEGDTFIQRYDCLKTYPFSSDDYQSVVEIASFMVETHVNIDGRYDRNRGLSDNYFANPTNFNLINTVYNQQNNFFQYNTLDDEYFNTTNFQTRFTWSLDKINGQGIDEWTRTNTAAFYDCDGSKGRITSLRKFNDQIYAFQTSGISRIKYNENAIISTENGVPVELGNSNSVNGVEYVSEMVGSQNKWSCVSTPVGIFFVDNNTPGIYRLGGGKQILSCLTDNCMQRWFESRNEEGFVNTASYDGIMNEVLFTYGSPQDEESLVFNNDYQIFSSFYDYKGVIGNIKNHSFNIFDNFIYFLREDDLYNSFYHKYDHSDLSTNPYWITIVSNPASESGPNANCIFNNVWYNADVVSDTNEENMNYDELIEMVNDKIPLFHDEKTSIPQRTNKWYETFDKIEAGNDYQYGIFQQYYYPRTQTKYFQFIKKFRTWRVPVPRSQRNAPIAQYPNVNLNRDRIRGSWARIKLSNQNPSTNKMVLSDIQVDALY